MMNEEKNKVQEMGKMLNDQIAIQIGKEKVYDIDGMVRTDPEPIYRYKHIHTWRRRRWARRELNRVIRTTLDDNIRSEARRYVEYANYIRNETVKDIGRGIVAIAAIILVPLSCAYLIHQSRVEEKRKMPKMLKPAKKEMVVQQDNNDLYKIVNQQIKDTYQK